MQHLNRCAASVGFYMAEKYHEKRDIVSYSSPLAGGTIIKTFFSKGSWFDIKDKLVLQINAAQCFHLIFINCLWFF